MKKFYAAISAFFVLGILFLIGLGEEAESANKVRRTGHPAATEETKAARDAYFHKLLRDPGTNAIPAAMRTKELQFYKERNFEAYEKQQYSC